MNVELSGLAMMLKGGCEHTLMKLEARAAELMADDQGPKPPR